MVKEKKKKKSFGCFTIIIIGIILFFIFSFIIYNVHTSGQKAAFEKVRHNYVLKDYKQIVWIIRSDEKNCRDNSSKYLIYELLLCEERTPEKIIKALIKTNKKIIVYDNNTYFLDKNRDAR